jgi:glycosyltransferase involved in cell wall biosynthesis
MTSSELRHSMPRILAVTNMYPTPLAPWSGTFVEHQVKSLTHIGLAVDVVVINRLQEGMCAYLDLERRVQSRIEEFEPDVVHVMYGGVMADKVTRIVKDRPTIVSFCGSDLLGEHLSGTLRRLISEYGVRASYKAARRAAGIIVKSKNLQAALPCDVEQSKIKIIPNGIDLDRFKPLDLCECRRRLTWDPNTFHVLFPANSGDPVKRPELAQAAVDRLHSMGIRSELHHLCGVPNTEVPLWLNASDVLLLTSLHEGSPNIVKEALACDLPVVSVDVGDVKERIEEVSGCYIANSDSYDLADKLCLVYSGKRRVFGRIKVQGFSLECIALQLKGMYDELL